MHGRNLTLVLAGLVTLFAGCAAPPNVAAGGATTASLEARSSIACNADAECVVCYRQGGCGEPMAANDPHAAEPACHVTPAAFCMPRRARCENHSCVAR